jgi:hypothetical protein
MPCACKLPSQHLVEYVPFEHRQPRLAPALGLALLGVLNFSFIIFFFIIVLYYICL